MTTVTAADLERTRVETLQHIHEVRSRLCDAGVQIINRAHAHDASKLVEPELSGFAALTVRLADVEFGTSAYTEALAAAAGVVDHHYALNDHHPNHFPGGIVEMNLLQILEFLADCAAASLRTKGGSLGKSLAYNILRFQIEPQLARVLWNTARDMKWLAPWDVHPWASEEAQEPR